MLNSYLIINNEPVLNTSLEQLLLHFPSLYSVGKATNAEQGMNLILKNNPDVVFFNIDSVMRNSFDFVNEVRRYLQIPPQFMAFSETKAKAYDALKHNFSDYLLKPVSELEFRKAIMQFRNENSKTLTKYFVKDYQYDANKTICLKSYKDYQYISLQDILFLKADNNSTDFYIRNKDKICAYRTLKTFESQLPGNFLRIHKSYIVNKNYVCRINFGKSRCTIDSFEEKLPFTKTYIDNIELINTYLSNISVNN